MSNVPKDVASYLNSLHTVQNVTDLTTCSWAINDKTLVARQGRLPIPIGPRLVALEGQALNDHLEMLARQLHPRGSNTTEQPNPKRSVAILTEATQTQPAIPARTSSPDSTDPGPQSQGQLEPQGQAQSQGQPQPQGQPQSQGQNTGGGGGIGAVIASAVGDQASNPPPSQPNVFDIGGGSVSVAPAPGPTAPGVVVGGVTVPAGQAATVNGVQVSVPADGGSIIVGGTNTVAVPGPGAGSGPQVVTVGGSVAAIAPAAPGSNGGAVVIGGQTIQPGQVATINGAAVSVPASGGSVVVAGGQTISVPAAGPVATPTLTLGGSVITANPSGGFVVAPGVTLTPGGPPVTVGGSTLSLGPGGTIAVVNGVTQTVGLSNPTGLPVLTINGQAITASVSGSSTAFVLGPGTTLTPGGSLVISGTTYGLPATGSAMVINGQTSTFGAASITSAPQITISGHTYSAITSNGKTYYDLGSGTTLTPGGSIVVDGTTISLASDGSTLMFGTSTSKIGGLPKTNNATTTTSSSSTTGHVGDAIASGLGTTKKSAASPVLPNMYNVAGVLVPVAMLLVGIFKSARLASATVP
jgi:hypothetical protein